MHISANDVCTALTGTSLVPAAASLPSGKLFSVAPLPHSPVVMMCQLEVETRQNPAPEPLGVQDSSESLTECHTARLPTLQLNSVYFILLVNIDSLKMATLLLEGREIDRYGDLLELDRILTNIGKVTLGKICTLSQPRFRHP